MGRDHLIHRDEMLRQTGKMPPREPDMTNEEFESRKSKEASKVSREWGLRQKRVDGSRALRYSQQQVDRMIAEHVHELPPIAA